MEIVPTQALLEAQPRKLINQSRKLYLQWRIADLLSSIFNCFSLISAITDYELGFSENRTTSNCADNPEPIYR